MVDADASSEAGAACAAAADLLDALLPAVLAALASGVDEVSAAVAPFLLAYVARLRTVHKVGRRGLCGWCMVGQGTGGGKEDQPCLRWFSPT